jgi:hypothetical protein
MTNKKELNLGTFKDFAKSLENAFKSENTEKEALYKLDTLHQGTRVAEDHVARFQALVVRAGLKEEKDIIRKFEKSLAQHVRAHLTHLETIKDLEDWYAKAIKCDLREREYRADLRDYKPTYKPITPSYATQVRGNNNHGHPTYKAPKEYMGEPMEIGHMSNQEHAKHMKEGLCFKCHQAGHTARDPKFHPQQKTNYRCPQGQQQYTTTPNNNYHGNTQHKPWDKKTFIHTLKDLSPSEREEIYQEGITPDIQEQETHDHDYIFPGTEEDDKKSEPNFQT